MKFVPAVDYHLCLNLPATFSQPGNGSLAGLVQSLVRTFLHARVGGWMQPFTEYQLTHVGSARLPLEFDPFLLAAAPSGGAAIGFRLLCADIVTESYF